MVLLNTKKVRILALFVAMLSIGAISSSNANAASTFGTYTDNDGVVWDAETNDDGDIYIGIHSVPSSLTTVTVPSLSDVASGKTTYFLDAVCSRKATPDCSSVIADTANVTKLDMTNTSGIQIKNVSQMFNTSHEVELKFGANVVIADPADIDLSQLDSSDWGNWHSEANVDYYATTNALNPYDSYTGAFEGMKVKLTDLSNVKYIGWNAFKGATLSANSRDVTINNNQTIGGYIFAGSNITGLSLDVTEVGQGTAMNCIDLVSLTIGDNVTKIYSDAFRGTLMLVQSFDSKNITELYGSVFKHSGISGATFGASLTKIGPDCFKDTILGTVDFSNSSVQIVSPGAFNNAGVTSLNLGNVQWLGESAFAKNSFTEAYLPKSFRVNSQEGAAHSIFENTPLTKLTVAFDMMTTGCTGYPIKDLIGRNAWMSVAELVILAPYGENEQPTADHDYSYANSDAGYPAMALPNDLRNSLKNVIPRTAFMDSAKIKKVIIDDNYEMIGSEAFLNSKISEIRTIKNGVVSEKMELPSKLKVIGSNAFNDAFGNDGSVSANQPVVEMDALPAGLLYIGEDAFLYDTKFVLTNFNLENLVYLGQAAFYHTNVINITLNAKPEKTTGLFLGSYMVKNITINYDYYKDWNYEENYFMDMFCNGNNCNIGTYDEPLGMAHLETVTFTSASKASPVGIQPYQFQGIYVDTMDLGDAEWTKLFDYDYFGGSSYDGAQGVFIGAKIGTLTLPRTLQVINKTSFAGAEIDNPLTIPNTVITIGDDAFNVKARGPYNSYMWSIITPGVKITALPSSIQKIGKTAFLDDTLFTADVNLPDLTYLGFSAFQGTNVRDVVINSGITTLGINAFYDTPSLRNVTVDLDLYSVTRDGYGDIIDNAGTQWESISLGYCFMQSGDPCDGTTDEEKKAQRDANFYDSFVATFGDQNHKYGTITFTENAGEPCGGFMNCTIDRTDYTNPANRPYFYGLKAAKVDLSATNWKTTSESMFQESEIDELILPSGLQNFARDTFYQVELGDVSVPTTLVAIQEEAFQWATANIDGLPEGLGYIGPSAFYGADVTDNLVIPGTVSMIGQSAFNAGDEDVHYDTITIKPSLNIGQTSGQLIFQLFWNVDVDKMIIASMGLPAGVVVPEGQTMPEFYGMPMDEVVITNLSAITKEAFQDCTNLKKVDMSSDANLRAIYDKAFINASKLDTILFSPSIKEQIVIVGSLAFKGTAFKTMGDSTKQFDLTAAKFDASAGSAFAEMPLLETVDVPRSFSGATVPEATFANDPELRLATIDYKVTLIDNAAFSNDNKLESIFIWGNTTINDENLPPAAMGGSSGMGASTDGENGVYADPTVTRGANDQGRGAGEYGPTIPEGTDIYAYSTSPAEDYAALPVRTTFEGEFYPLDEVLYITSNKPTVLINDDATDFDKGDLIVYAMRRDGIILESDEWSVYDGNAYPRATSDVDFEAMAQAIQDNPVFASIHDTPVPMDELDITTNVNFENIDFALIPDADNENIKKVTILYNDKYTENLADTDILPYQEGDDEPIPAPVVPDTGTKAMRAFMNAGLPVATIAVISVLGSILIYKKRRG